MRIENARAQLLTASAMGGEALKVIETFGRLSWKSEGKMTDDSAPAFVKMLLSKGHESVIEHVTASARFVVDRGVSHEIVRHRLASYTQESTRYCNYSKTGEVTFIKPCFWSENSQLFSEWRYLCEEAESAYLVMLGRGAKPQEARSVLPHSLKTELVMTANLREWRHFFQLRTAPPAHPQMREVAIPLLAEFKAAFPVIFDDIEA